MNYEELPTAPTTTEAATEETVPVPSMLTPEQLEAVSSADAVPAGLYHIRANRFMSGWAEKPEKGFEQYGPQPYYQVFWTIQQEPYVGCRVTDFFPWVSQAVLDDAVSQDRTKRAQARALMNDRMWKITSLREALGQQGPFDFTAILAENPELKADVTVRAKKTKNADGTYSPTDEMQNGIKKYYPLMGRR